MDARDLAGMEFELGPETPSGALDLDSMDLDEDERRAVRQAADAWIQDGEERWCDESIPALDGLTPREAAADPTRRGDLLALLDSMPAPSTRPSGAGGFDPDRLREHLGLV